MKRSTDDFRRAAHAAVDWIADYLDDPRQYPVLPKMRPGDLIDRLYLQELNERLLKVSKQSARASQVLLGVTKASLSTESFLSASSVQHTIKVLAGAAIEGKVDFLRGLKENVIIGKLIPAGTGFPGEQVVLHDERLDEAPVEPVAEAEPQTEEATLQPAP